MSLKSLKLSIIGVTPLLFHSDNLCNPLYERYSEFKKITSKRSKTEDDLFKMWEIEWYSSLHYNNEGIYIPSFAFRKCLSNGGKLSKQGSKIDRSVMVDDHVNLKYKGPTKLQKLYENKDFVDIRPVRVGSSKVTRCRPIFCEWSGIVDITYESSQIDSDIIFKSTEDAGKFCGLLDFRPNKGGYYGKFNVEEG